MNYQTLPFPEFLDQLRFKIREVFREKINYNQFNKRGVPQIVLDEIMPMNPLSILIPTEYGGRGGSIDQNLALISAAAYESLPLALTFGINTGLFLQPVIKYADEDIKKLVFRRFLEERSMGGLMITEPDYGSDALNMQTHFSKINDTYHLQGIKHWAGLTGFADFWLLTAREKHKSGHLKRDIDFFICDVKSPGQQIVVEEFFDNLGLHQIPYGRNIIDVEIPEIQRLEPKTSGINLMLDTLHRSRLQFPAMALGFVQRMMDEAIEHCKQRKVGNKTLIHYDQVQQRLARLQAYYTIASAMCWYTSEKGSIENDLSTCGLEANSFKSISSDMMQHSAQSLVQLVGARAFRYSHIGGRGIADSRPFQIFEGSNDIMFAQISESLIKQMKQTKEHNLYRFLENFSFTKHAARSMKDQLNFEPDLHLHQRKAVELGELISHLIAKDMVIQIGKRGFRKELVHNARTILRQDIIKLMGNFRLNERVHVIEDYHDNSSWNNYIEK